VKIKKAKLLQIIKEELARVDEATNQRQLEDDLYNRWIRGDEGAFDELYKKIRPSIVKFLMRQGFKTMSKAKAEDIAQEVFTNLHANPGSFGGRAALSTFLQGNALKLVISDYRRVLNKGGEVTASGETTTHADAAQQAGQTVYGDPHGGSRFPNPEAAAIAKQELGIIQDLINSGEFTPRELKILNYISGVGDIETIKDLAAELGLANPTSTGRPVGALRSRLKDLTKENEDLQETDRTWDSDPTDIDREKSTEDEIIYLNDTYSDVYKELYNFKPGSRPPFRTPEAAAEAIEDLYARMEAREKSAEADAIAAAEEEAKEAEIDALMPGPEDRWEDLPLGGSINRTSPHETPVRKRQRGTFHPQRPIKRQRRSLKREAKSLEEMVEAVVKEILNS